MCQLAFAILQRTLPWKCVIPVLRVKTGKGMQSQLFDYITFPVHHLACGCLLKAPLGAALSSTTHTVPQCTRTCRWMRTEDTAKGGTLQYENRKLCILRKNHIDIIYIYVYVNTTFIHILHPYTLQPSRGHPEGVLIHFVTRVNLKKNCN